MPSASALRLQIETALSRRIPSALTPAPKILRPITPTGVAEVDTLLGGGLPLGAITEMSGLESSGRTSLALSAMARITQKGGVCAWIDAGDALHVESAAAAGVDLSRLLWVRCGAAASPEETAGEKFSFSVPSLAQSPKRKGLHGQGIGGHPRHETKGLSDAVSELLKPAAAGRYDAGHQPRKHLGRSPNEPGMRAAMPRAESAQLYPAAKIPDWIFYQGKSTSTNFDRVRLCGFCSKTPSRAQSPKPWTRMEQALAATDLLLQAGGFSAIVLDMAGIKPEHVSRIEQSIWFRYRAAAERTQASLLLLTQHPCAKSAGELLLRFHPGTPRCNEKTVFAGMEHRLEIARRRFAPSSFQVVPLKKPSRSENVAFWQSHATWVGGR